MIGPSRSKHIFIVLTILFLYLFSSNVFAKPEISEQYTNLIPKIQEKINKYPQLLCGVYIKASWLKGEININGDYLLPAASLIKLPIGVVLLNEIDKGNLSFNDILEMKEKHIVPGSGILKNSKAGKRLKLKELFELMLVISDNTAFNMIVDHLGGIAACNRKMSQIGLNNTVLIEFITDFKEGNKCSSYDLVRSVEIALEEDLLKPSTRDYLKDVLLRAKNRSMIPAGLPRGTKVGHKTGTIGITIGDAGVIYKGRNKKIYISIIVKRPFNSHEAYLLIREISRLVFSKL